MNPGLVTASVRRAAHETIGFPSFVACCFLISFVISVLLFCPSLAGHPKGEWVPAREAKVCFLRRCQESRVIDSWRSHKREARRSRSIRPQCPPARRGVFQLAVSAREGQKREPQDESQNSCGPITNG